MNTTVQTPRRRRIRRKRRRNSFLGLHKSLGRTSPFHWAFFGLVLLSGLFLNSEGKMGAADAFTGIQGVPEPSSLTVILVGAATAVFFYKRRPE